MENNRPLTFLAHAKSKPNSLVHIVFSMMSVMSNHISSQYFSFSSIRRQQQSSSVDDDNEMAEMNRSLLELSLDRYPTGKCKCKGACKRGCPCRNKDQRFGDGCSCNKSKCANKMEEANIFSCSLICIVL